MCLLLQRVFLSNKQGKDKKKLALWAQLKASAGHIWPAGRMLCMPELISYKIHTKLTHLRKMKRMQLFLSRSQPFEFLTKFK